MKMTVEMKTISKLKATSKIKTTSELKTTSKMEGTKKVKTFSERKETSKVKTTSKIGLPLNKICLPPSPPIKNLPDFLLMTSHPDSHTTTDVKPEIIPGVQTGNGIPHDEYDICGIAHARTNRKDNIFMQRRPVQKFTFILEWGPGTCSLTKHTWHWTYSALVYLFNI